MRLKFDARLYSEAAVEAAARAYAGVAKCRVARKGAQITVEAAPAGKGRLDELFADEFGNYVLGAMRG